VQRDEAAGSHRMNTVSPNSHAKTQKSSAPLQSS
jgi:hypothetical protein